MPADRSRSEIWSDELRRAASELDPARHGSLFLEEREDLRVVACSWDAREVLHSRLRGLALRGSATEPAASFLTDPGLSDCRRLVRGAASPARPTSAGAEPCRLDPDEAVRITERLLSQALARCDRPGAWAVARWVSFEQEVKIARARRSVATDVRRGARVRLDVGTEAGGRRAEASGELVLRPGRSDGIDALAASVPARAAERLEASGASAGECAVVFASGVGGILIHEIVGHALEADTVREGGSLLAARGRAVAPASVVVVDDPRRGRGAWRIDDEAVEARATALLHEGSVAGYLHDVGTAAEHGARPTGHGRRASFRERVRPRMGCTFLGPGRMRPEEVLESVTSGIHVRRMEAASADPIAGTALFHVTDADRVRAGKLVGALDPFHLLVHTLSALSSLSHIGSDLSFDSCVGSCVRDGQPLAASVGAPTFRIGVGRVIC